MVNYKEIIARNNPAQNHWELEQVIHLVKVTQPKIVVEIGAHRGGGVRVWRDVFNPHILLGIENSGEFAYPDIKVIRGKSQLQETKEEVIRHLGRSQIGYLHIDGGHTYEDVSGDFKMYSPLMKKGSFIGFHDINVTNLPNVDVHKFWSELKQEYPHVEILCPKGYSSGTGTGLIWLE